MVRDKKALRFRYRVKYSERFTDDVADTVGEIEDLIRNRFKRNVKMNAFLFENDSEDPLTPDWVFIREYNAKPNPVREKEVTLFRRNISKKTERVR